MSNSTPVQFYLEVDLAVFQPVHAALVEEVEVFDEEAEEGDDNLQDGRGKENGLFFIHKWFFVFDWNKRKESVQDNEYRYVTSSRADWQISFGC